MEQTTGNHPTHHPTHHPENKPALARAPGSSFLGATPTTSAYRRIGGAYPTSTELVQTLNHWYTLGTGFILCTFYLCRGFNVGTGFIPVQPKRHRDICVGPQAPRAVPAASPPPRRYAWRLRRPGTSSGPVPTIPCLPRRCAGFVVSGAAERHETQDHPYIAPT